MKYHMDKITSIIPFMSILDIIYQ